MALHIIIDGYNLIRQSATLSPLDRKDLQMGRDALVNKLAVYRKLKKHSITVVFDGTYATENYEREFQKKGIRVLFSKYGETADSVIKRKFINDKTQTLIVSSDRGITKFVESHGVATISSIEFEKNLMASQEVWASFSSDYEEECQGWTPKTKKKGPSKRLSKRERKNKKISSKL